MDVGRVDVPLPLLIRTPFGRDAAHLCKSLGAEGFDCIACNSMEELTSRLAGDVGAILTSEEALVADELGILVDALKNQPPWSAIPVLFFHSRSEQLGDNRPKSAALIHDITDIVLLHKPISLVALTNTVRGALRDRKRQYQTKRLLSQLQQDIHQRERDQEELRLARTLAEDAQQTAERANLTKSQFLANMSHEIRTPLGAIIGFSELISQSNGHWDEVLNYASVISRNSRQLLRIIDDILDLSKVEAGRMEIESVQFSLSELLFDVTSLLRVRANGNSLVLGSHTEENLPDTICSDPTRLRQILTNVIGNAIKFTDKGRVDLYTSFSNGVLKFEVTDTGRGISADQARSLFQPFQQADAATNRRYGGTGLGLVLTRNLCRAMGGDLVLQSSELGQGSTFVASVRIVDPAIQMEEQEALGSAFSGGMQGYCERGGTTSGPSRLNGMELLLVEDSVDNQALIKTMLEQEGAHVDVVSDGRLGIEKALSIDYDAILMDIQMPIMDGKEAARSLRSQGLELPVIALTAHAMNEQRDEVLGAGFSFFLAKPVEREQLVELLASLGHRK